MKKDIGKKTRFSSSYQPKNRGRKKSKLKQCIEENDLSHADVRAAIQMILDKDMAELNKIMDDDKKPLLLRYFVKCFLEDFEKGRMFNVEKMVEMIWGKPDQTNINKTEISVRPFEIIKSANYNKDS